MKKSKLLVFGYINTNVLDGSSIFLSSLSQVLSIDNTKEVHLLLAVPNKRNTVLGELENKDNIHIIDPFEDNLYEGFDFFSKEQMTHREAAELIKMVDDNYDYDNVFVRSIEVSTELSEIDPSVSKKTFHYLTGITSNYEIPTSDNLEKLNLIVGTGSRLMCQTEKMKRYVVEKYNIEDKKIITLNPMIPDNFLEFSEVFKVKDNYSRFIYSGKFAYEWNTVEMITQFREVQENLDDITLDVIGDQFKRNVLYPNFVANAHYLINNSKNVIWHGAVQRKQSIEMIKDADVGITWRNASLDDSLELSTKLLEYCSMGTPPILNKNEMHVEILGEDYPLYANSEKDFRKALEVVNTEPKIVQKAAEIAFNASKKFSFSNTYLKLISEIESNPEIKKIIEIAQKAHKNNIYFDEKYVAVRFEPKNIINLFSDLDILYDITGYQILNDTVVFTKESDEKPFNKQEFFKIMCLLLNKYYKKKQYQIDKNTLANNKTNLREATEKEELELKLDKYYNMRKQYYKLKKELNLSNKRLEHQKDYANRLTEQRNRYKDRMNLLEEKLSTLTKKKWKK